MAPPKPELSTTDAPSPPHPHPPSPPVTPPSSPPRTPPPIPCYWCQLHTFTYIIINSFMQEPSREITPGLANPLDQDLRLSKVLDNIATALVLSATGGSVIPVAVLANIFPGLTVAHASNHQITYGVLFTAVSALKSFFRTYKAYGSVKFMIFDGNNQVGIGSWQFVPLAAEEGKRLQ